MCTGTPATPGADLNMLFSIAHLLPTRGRQFVPVYEIMIVTLWRNSVCAQIQVQRDGLEIAPEMVLSLTPPMEVANTEEGATSRPA